MRCALISRPLAVTVGAVLICTGCSRITPADTFHMAVTNPTPGSVIILNSRSREFSAVDHYLHFTISPADLSAVVLGGQYEREDRPSLDFHLVKDRPSWWTPEKLGDGVILFKRVADKNRDIYWDRYLYVNSSSNEVYCCAAPIFR